MTSPTWSKSTPYRFCRAFSISNPPRRMLFGLGAVLQHSHTPSLRVAGIEVCVGLAAKWLKTIAQGLSALGKLRSETALKALPTPPCRGAIRGGRASPRAARTRHHPAAYFLPGSKHAPGFGHDGSRGRDPSRRCAHTHSKSEADRATLLLYTLTRICC